MALHFVLNINDQPLGVCVIQRREVLDLTDPDAIADTVSTYDVTVHEQRSNTERAAVVEHRYGDGAWALVRAGLNAAFDDEQAEVRA